VKCLDFICLLSKYTNSQILSFSKTIHILFCYNKKLLQKKKKKKKLRLFCINKFVDMKRFFNDSIDADAKTMLQLKF
jgi:hypothetical protein